MRTTLTLCVVLAGIFLTGVASAGPRYVLAGATPGVLAQAQRTGDADPNATIDITLWFAPHNRADLDRRVAQEYDRGSPLYHQWLDRRRLGQMFGATDAEVAAARDFLARGGLSVVDGDPGHFYLRARGRTSVVAEAFHVQFANFTFHGRAFRAATTDPEIDDPAGANIAAVMGLDTLGFQHPLIRQADLLKLPPQAAPTDSTQRSTGFNSVCFSDTAREKYTTEGGPPTAIFTGNRYDFGVAGCGYSPPQIAAAYGLDKLYAQGLDGSGQRIGIIDWCGSPTILGDANKFSKRFGLPPLVERTNFFLTSYQGQPDCAAPDPEINIDVEWAHAIAPGAAIQLIVALAPDFQDIASAIISTLELSDASVISNSYGSEESGTPKSVIDMLNFLNEAGAAAGVALNFSTGDDGDFTDQGSGVSVSTPADSPYATGIGGVSLALKPDGAIQFQAGWGTNDTTLAGYGGPLIPVFHNGLMFGSGGGTSKVFAKPAYQASLSGTRRLLPDISWLGDPFTGGIIAISVQGAAPELQYLVYGGTSLACPMFSALWAIAEQAAGQNLGQAAPLLYAVPSGAITDILPVGSATNVTAKVDTGAKKYELTANMIAKPLEKTSTYYSALFNYPLYPKYLDALTFGTDSSLYTTAGWDDETGLGVADPVPFVASFMPAPAR